MLSEQDSLAQQIWVCAWEMRRLFNGIEFQDRVVTTTVAENIRTTQAIKHRCGRNSRSRRLDHFDQRGWLIAQAHHYVRRNGSNCTQPDPKWMRLNGTVWHTKHDDDEDQCEDCLGGTH